MMVHCCYKMILHVLAKSTWTLDATGMEFRVVHKDVEGMYEKDSEPVREDTMR